MGWMRLCQSDVANVPTSLLTISVDCIQRLLKQLKSIEVDSSNVRSFQASVATMLDPCDNLFVNSISRRHAPKDAHTDLMLQARIIQRAAIASLDVL